MSALPQAEKAKAWLGILVAVSTVITPLLILSAIGAVVVFGERVRPPVQEFLGITDLQRQVTELRGDDRIARVARDRSHVVEPVYRGETARLVLYIARTEVGIPCQFAGGSVVFVDAFNISYPGGEVAVQRQVDHVEGRFVVLMRPPPTMPVGRGTVYLQLHYVCDGRNVFENTPEFPFRLLSPQNPDD